MSLLVLSSADVEELAASYAPRDLQLLMGRVFALLSSSQNGQGEISISMPPRIVIPTLHHTALFMPARIGVNPRVSTDGGPSSSHSFLGGTAVKVVCVPDKSDPRGLPGTTLVLDENTGAAKAIVNARNLTALRNAAGSLLSTSLVGPSYPVKIVAFGAGKQIDAHLDLHIRHFPSIRDIVIVNRSINPRAQSLTRKFNSSFPQVNFTLLSPHNSQESEIGIEESVRAADIIICATSSTVPLFPSSWVRTGTHVILIGSYTPAMKEIDAKLVLRAISDKSTLVTDTITYRPYLLVDSRSACADEAGELIAANISSGQMTEIGEMIPRNASGDLDLEVYNKMLTKVRPRNDEFTFDGPITIFKSVGVGLQDVAIACAIVEKAELVGAGIIGSTISNYDVGQAPG
ncbi:hypothetical protein B0H34DRAFT_784757 [Crassisporium funariophilum]|nr:hypothetical protein B0H34DRAFT_784757 [Crassisporium funariophilum]